jgi:formylglycine-generating enzyme required for sulfatase activity
VTNTAYYEKGSHMADFAELELGLYRIESGRYSLRCRFWQPGGAEESDLGLNDPAPVCLDFEALLALQANPTTYGARLCEMLFADQAARAAFGKARERADALKVALRLRLYFDSSANELHELYWETLVDPDSNRRTRLSADENVPFSRYLSSANLQPFTPSETARPRALVFISGPSNLDPARFAPIDPAAELSRAEKGLGDMEIVPLAGSGQATLAGLLEGLRGTSGSVDILYLVAHGFTNRSGEPCVLLEKPDGRGDAVPVERLVTELKALRSLPLLAVLVSCESAGSGTGSPAGVLQALGPQLARCGIPAVLAMRGSVSFPTIDRFLPAFFRELIRDGQIDRALAAARGQIGDELGWWMPVLFSRLRDNRLMQPPVLARPMERQPYEPETIYIPSGAFLMGRDGVAAWEKPCHTVTLPGYRIGKYPVTNRQFLEYVRQTGALVNPESGWDGQTPPPDRLDYPVIGVTWYQATAYCEWLSKTSGRRYTLPTEAQWEKAARGVDGRLYPWGNEWQPGHCGQDPMQITAVDQFPAQSDYGVFDLVGNVREWTLSLWGESSSAPRFLYPWAEDERNDPKANPLVRRVYRGGVMDNPAEMTCTLRGGFDPSKSGPPRKRHGFRVVLTVSS